MRRALQIAAASDSKKRAVLRQVAKKRAREILADKIRESSVGKASETDFVFRQFVEMDWKSYLQRKSVKPSTLRGYDCVLGKHILPVLGQLHIGQIQPLDIDHLVQSKMEDQLSRRTIRNILVILQSIFSLALDNDVIDRSPVRKKHRPELPRSSKPTWTPEQVRKIIDEVPADHRVLFTLAALTGLRIGEILALQWKHVDFEARRLQIVQSLWEGQIVEPKTNASVRTIQFGSHLATVLTRHLEVLKRSVKTIFFFARMMDRGYAPTCSVEMFCTQRSKDCAYRDRLDRQAFTPSGIPLPV